MKRADFYKFCNFIKALLRSLFTVIAVASMVLKRILLGFIISYYSRAAYDIIRTIAADISIVMVPASSGAPLAHSLLSAEACLHFFQSAAVAVRGARKSAKIPKCILKTTSQTATQVTGHRTQVHCQYSVFKQIDKSSFHL